MLDKIRVMMISGEDSTKSVVRYMVLVVAFTRVMLNVVRLRTLRSLTHMMSALALVEQIIVLPGKPRGG